MNRYTGRAGELRVQSELMLRGMNFAEVDLDNGVDLITVPGGKRIQIKTSKSDITSCRGYKYPVYLFNTRKKKYVNSKNKTLRPKIKHKQLDFVICWCIDHDWFFIILIKEVTQTNINIPINPKNPNHDYKYTKYKDAWKLLLK